MQSFASRLKSARKIKGWSLQDLADKMENHITKQALSKYEQGSMKPSGEVLAVLSKALGVKTDFFLRTATLELGDVEFRKTAKLSVKQIDSIEEQVKEYLERYLEVEQLLNVNVRFKKPIEQLIVTSVSDVENAVVRLKKALNIGVDPIANVIEMLEESGVRVLEMDLPEEFDGLSTYVGNIPVIVINKNYTIERKRFTALHELGHLILPICEGADKEKVCHAFAGAMLLPYESLIKLIGNKRKNIAIGELVAIKEQFGISIQAIMMRAQRAGIISSSGAAAFWRFIADNKKEIGLGQYPGVEKSVRFELMVFRLAAEEIVSLSKAANLAGKKLAVFRKDLDAA